MPLLEDTGIDELIPRVQDDPGWNPVEVNRNAIKLREIEEERRRELEEHEASIMTGITGSWKYETGTGVGLTMLSDAIKYDQDESFNVSEAMAFDADEFPKEVPWEQAVLKDAKSEPHYEVLKDRIKGKREFMLNMEDMGMLPSLGLQMVSEIGNLPNYLTFGLSGLKKAGKLKRFLVSGGITGTANVAEEAFINKMYNDRTVTDYVVAGSLGMGLGWLGTLGGKDTKLAKHMDDTGESFSEVHMKNSVDERSDAFYGPPESTVGAEQIKDVHKTFDPDFDPEVKKPRMDEDNATVQGTFQALISGDIPKAKKLFHQTFGLTSMSQSLHSSDNPITRYIGSKLFEYPEGVGRWNDHTAALKADKDFQFFSAGYNKQYIDIKAEWNTLAEQQGITHTFDEAASIWVSGGGKIQGTTLQLDEILEKFNNVYTQWNDYTYKKMHESGVAEAKAMDYDSGHIYRGWDGKKFHKLRNEYGDDAIVETLQESILQGNAFKSAHEKAAKEFDAAKKVETDRIEVEAKTIQTEVDTLITKLKSMDNELSPEGLRASRDIELKIRELEAKRAEAPDVQLKAPDIKRIAKRMAEATYHRFLKRATVSTADANLLSTANRTLMKDILDDIPMDKADRGHIDAVLETMGKDQKANPMKHQMGMDLAYTHKSGLRVLDMMHTDLGSAYASKQRYWLGRAAAAEKGFESEEVFQEAIEQIKRHGSDRGMDDVDIRADVERLEAGWKMLKGQPVEPMDQFGYAAMRIMRKAMGVSALGKLGMVQAGETGRVMAAAGITNIIDGIPFIKNMIMDIKDGRLDTAMLKDIEEFALGKIGDDHYMNHPDFRADDFGHKIHKAEQQLDRMSYWLSKASGWHLVHTQQRKQLMNYLGHRYYDWFVNDKMTRAQMKDLGVPIHHIDGIKKMMKKHAKFDDNDVLESLNLRDWEPELRETIALMMHRKSTNAVQDIITGETPLWINRGLGKFLGQFRSFSIAALGKQTVHDYRMFKEGDKEAALAFQFMLATSTMAVVARTAFDAASLPERERKAYLRRSLHPGAITKKILNYHGQASPLVDMTDLLASAVMPNSWGQLTGSNMYNRGGVFNKIPGISYGNRVAKGISGLAKGIMPGEEMSKSDWNAFVGSLPLSSWYGFHALNKRVVTPALFD